jgi:MOSC domain-containing protein YiiM
MLRKLNLEGDGQADLTVHGGRDKAVYAYPAEHYSYWRSEFSEMNLPWGMFGENLTTQGLSEENVRIGQRFQIGTAELIVTEPRLPCYKLGLRFGRNDIIKRFLASRRTGFYFRIVREGVLAKGDVIRPAEPVHSDISVADITALYAFEKDNFRKLKSALEVEALPESWKGYFRRRLEKQAGQAS